MRHHWQSDAERVLFESFIYRYQGPVGGVAEWLNAPVLKTDVGESLPWVRIPPPPPELFLFKNNILIRIRINLLDPLLDQVSGFGDEKTEKARFMTRNCPVCNTRSGSGHSTVGDFIQIECPRCGDFEITLSALAMLKNRTEDRVDERAAARASHAIRNLQRHTKWPRISSYQVDDLVAARLPSLDQQVANLIRWILEQVDDDQLSPVEEPNYDEFASVVGAVNGERVHDLFKHAFDSGLIKFIPDTCIALTPKGARSMKNMMTDKLTFVKSDGSAEKSDIAGVVTSGQLVTFDTSIQVLPGDRFLRHLPNGLVEEFIVDDPGYHSGVDEPCYVATVHRSDAAPASPATIINNIHGDNARVNVNSTDNSTNTVAKDERTQIYAQLREKLNEIDDSQKAATIAQAIDAMEAAQDAESLKDRYLQFMAVTSDHVGVFGPLLGLLAGVVL